MLKISKYNKKIVKKILNDYLIDFNDRFKNVKKIDFFNYNENTFNESYEFYIFKNVNVAMECVCLFI